MSRTVGVVLVLLLALPAAWADDKPKDKPMTPEEQYKALLKEQQDAMKAYQEAFQKATTAEEKKKVREEMFPKPEKAAPKFLELAEKNPKDPVAVDALVWVMTNDRAGGKDSPRAKAVALMLRDQVQSDKLVPVCQNLTYGYDKEGVELLRGVLDKNTHKDVQAEACLALAQRISQKAQMARHLKDHPEDAKRYEQALGKEYVEELTKADVAKVESESAGLFKDFGEKYAAQVKPDRLAQLFQRLGQSGEAGGEALLRALLEKDTRHDVQGMACLTLAQSLKARADGMPEAKAKDADKLRKESEEFFDRAGDKFADVKFGRGTVGDTAKRELFELRFLSIGKEAPEVEGEDIDGKKFKLTDYRGKVVLIDFWGDW